MTERTGRIRKLGRVAMITGLLVVCSRGSRAEERDGCYRATISAPIVLPDGTRHASGELRICVSQRLSPVQWLHAMYVGGDAVGAFRGNDSRIERLTEPGRPEFVFLKESDGSLRLFGFTTSDPAGARLHRFVPRATVGDEWTSGSIPGSDQPPGLFVVAAARP